MQNQKLGDNYDVNIDTNFQIINAIIISLTILIIIFLLAAGATEPGIIPRVADPSANLPYIYK